MKDYLLKLLERCSDENFGQEAVEHAILNGQVQLTYDLERDLRLIMGEPGRPETGLYDQIFATYLAVTQQHAETLLAVYESSGLMAEILGVSPLHGPASAQMIKV